MQKGFVPVLVLVGILMVLTVGIGGYYFYQKNQIKNINSFDSCVKAGYKTVESELSPAKCTTPDGRVFTEQTKACTQEAKLCPDGSSVGRVGPNCEFAKCPAKESSPSADETANWKTYINDHGKYQYSYPPDWKSNEPCPTFTGPGCGEGPQNSSSVSDPLSKYPDGYFIVTYYSPDICASELSSARKWTWKKVEEKEIQLSNSSATSLEGVINIADEVLHDRRYIIVSP